jgi:hypothetical protein
VRAARVEARIAWVEFFEVLPRIDWLYGVQRAWLRLLVLIRHRPLLVPGSGGPGARDQDGLPDPGLPIPRRYLFETIASNVGGDQPGQVVRRTVEGEDLAETGPGDRQIPSLARLRLDEGKTPGLERGPGFLMTS